MVTGFGKGLVGTITKPVAGVLDFASGTASAVRDTSRSSARLQVRQTLRVRSESGGINCISLLTRCLMFVIEMSTLQSLLILQPPRCRKPRCCYGPGGLLPSYSKHHATAQEFLFSLNQNNYNEM